MRGEIALIGLSSGVPTGPLMATGRMGHEQRAHFAAMLEDTRKRGLARVVLIHHPPLLSGATAMRNMTDAREFEAVIHQHGAEVILHGHNHKRSVAHLKSEAAATVGGRIAVIGVPSASSTAKSLRQRAAYHLVRLERADGVMACLRAGARADAERRGDRRAGRDRGLRALSPVAKPMRRRQF